MPFENEEYLPKRIMKTKLRHVVNWRLSPMFSISIEPTNSLWGFLDLKSELIRKGETQNQGKNGQI